MNARGRLKDCYQDWKTGKFILSFEIESADENGLNEIVEADLDITAAKHREKRSLNANAYFHVLCGKIAEAVQGETNTAVKNRLIREYGQYEYIDGKIPTYLIKAEYEDAVLKRDGVHFQIIGYESHDGMNYIKAAVMRGSHTYDTKEMARLIDGAVSEAKDLGIETMPPQELKRMLDRWSGSTQTSESV